METSLDIFVPYWGDPDYMKLTIGSVLTQTDPRWFLTVIDDAYPDPTIENFVAGIADDRITYVKKPKNEGITASFRTSVRMASQDLVTVVGCDDVLLPNYVETILHAHETCPNADIIQPGVKVIGASGEPANTMADRVKQNLLRPKISEPTLFSGEELAISLLHGDWLYWPSLTFKTASIRTVDFRNEFPIIQDLALIMDMILQDRSLLLVSTECFAYRRHSESASSMLIMGGARFSGERDYFALAAKLAAGKGWRKAATAARLRLTSRAHALSILPTLMKNKDVRGLRIMFRHGLGA